MKKKTDDINLRDYFHVILKHKKLIALTTTTGMLIALIISLFLPNKYIATASLMPPNQDPLSTSIISKMTGNLGGGFNSLVGMKSPADMWIGILNSKNVNDEIVKRFDLKGLYGKKTLSGARKTLKTNVAIKKSKEDIISISVEDIDPERAANLAKAFIEELDRVNKSTVMTSGQRTRAFIEKRLQEAKSDLLKIEGEMKSFQQVNKAVKLDDQSKVIIEAIGTVKGQLMTKEVEFEVLQSFATPDNPQAKLLKTEVSGLKSRLRELEEGRNPSGKDIFIPTSRIPGLSFQYAQLYREAKIQETLFGLLSEQYEIARIQEAKDSPTVQILDVPNVPEASAKPNRPIIVLMSAIASFLISIFVAFFLEFQKKRDFSMPVQN